MREAEDTDEIGLGAFDDLDDLAFVFLALTFREHRDFNLVAMQRLACVVSSDEDVLAFFVRYDVSLAGVLHVDGTSDDLLFRTEFMHAVRMKQVAIRFVFYELAFFVKRDENLIYHVFAGSVAD